MQLISKPWGYYVNGQEGVTSTGAKFLVKQIVVNPKGMLSLQSHQHRDEFWIVTRGLLTVFSEEGTQDDGTYIIGQVLFIPAGKKHRIANLYSDGDLVLSEIQLGTEISEDDIVRYQDIYGRA